MPEDTQVTLNYRSSFMAKSSQGLVLKDILLIRTVLEDGSQYAFSASYDPRTQTITRAWGGHHDKKSPHGFSLP